MRKLILILCFIIPFKSDNPVLATEKTFDDAENAYLQLDLHGARSILLELKKQAALDNETRCKVLRKLAFQDWKFYCDKLSAIDRLDEAIKLGDAEAESLILKSRIEREVGVLTAAEQSARKAYEIAGTTTEMAEAAVEYAQTVYGNCLQNLKANEALNDVWLFNASEKLKEILVKDPAHAEAAKWLLGISLLKKEGEMAVYGWNSYYHITSTEVAGDYLKPHAAVLKKYLTGWDFQVTDRIVFKKIVEALANSRFYSYAALLATDFYGNGKELVVEDAEMEDILAYANYIEILKKETDNYYRKIATSSDRDTEEYKYRRFLQDHRRMLWNRLNLVDHEKQTFSEEAFLRITETYFGARGFTGSTGNFNGYVLCLGHSVNKQIKRINQYSYETELIFTQLDMMVSNGYSSWFWEDREIGGWANANEIVQVRSAYMSGPIRAWKMVTDSMEKAKLSLLISEGRASETDFGLKRSISLKLRLDVLNELYDSLLYKNLSARELYFSFINTYENYVQEASIFAHEGRHSIESRYIGREYMNWNSEKRELHAKFSEIIFSPKPRLALASMLAVMGDSGHGRANERIVNILLEYIENNSEQIQGFDSNEPVLAQILLLSDEQIKDCYKKTDPLYLNLKIN
ncbi:MAG: hypothetical protein R6U04_08370 [Bacteroidales bacterium]